MSRILQFATFSSSVEAPFWHALSQRKVDVYRLDDAQVPVLGYYQAGNEIITTEGETVQLPSRLCVGADGLEENATIPPFSVTSVGTLKNTNTIEEFKTMDKVMLFNASADALWDDIVTGQAVKEPKRLTRFLIITFADLKKYKFYYWFAFPALQVEPPWEWIEGARGGEIGALWNDMQIENFKHAYDKFRQDHPQEAGFFLVRLHENTAEVASLMEWETGGFFEGYAEEDRILGFVDPSSLPQNPGWPLRNLLSLVYYRWGQTRATLLCFREVPGKRDISQTRIIRVQTAAAAALPITPTSQRPKAVGWERNTQGKLGPRLTDLSHMMDPKRLADTAVDLNLKLMRWRLAPTLDLPRIQRMRCLLLGAGTLGCSVARSLLGWGVRHITFVDNAKVSFSNPVRQSLFEFEDCLEGGRAKAECAAEKIRRIYPGVECEGHTLSIPMPGHPLNNRNHAKAEVSKLEELIIRHDAVFLLTDSRESRWLPTVLGSRMGKLVINAALGFDTFVVMRHGLSPSLLPLWAYPPANPEGAIQLGCYFCNDIVAPVDSLSDRTLDQQCTVSRPGLSAVAGALAVELMVSVVQHNLGPCAPADTTTDVSLANRSSHPLGILPHQIRGFLSHFQHKLIVGYPYPQCTACSSRVLDEHESRGFDFVEQVCAEPAVLEELTGLAELKRESEDLMWDAEDLEEDV
ncbi:uncharacterized protein VTP21DRAFT_9477 [Calcarisporiella thermophila]|uniref:uncharacterized protein n=1 Tax=Calcarisporiella thermophila TaxID=911321 RepID=UPI003742B61A